MSRSLLGKQKTKPFFIQQGMIHTSNSLQELHHSNPKIHRRISWEEKAWRSSFYIGQLGYCTDIATLSKLTQWNPTPRVEIMARREWKRHFFAYKLILVFGENQECMMTSIVYIVQAWQDQGTTWRGWWLMNLLEVSNLDSIACMGPSFTSIFALDNFM